MKTVFRISLVSAIAYTMAVFSAVAQPGSNSGPGKGHGYGPGHGHGYPDSCRVQLMVDDMRQALSLNDQQVAKIEQIHYAHIQEMKAIDQQYTNDCVGARDARWALRDKIDSDVKAVLNEDQKVKYDEFVAERRGPHGHPHGNWK
jgi:Spy/CpxP family protein refolding chaperone